MSDIWDDPDLPSEAATEINRARQEKYGDPTPNMEVFAKLISPILGMEVSPEQAAMILVQLKVMREVQADYPIYYRDNLEDMCGWTNVLFKVKEARRATTDGPADGEGRVGGVQLPGGSDASKPARRSRGARGAKPSLPEADSADKGK